MNPPPAAARIRVCLLTKNFGTPDSPVWLRMTPGRSGRWGRCDFSVNRPDLPYDWLVVYDDLGAGQAQGFALACPAERTVLVTSEPASIKIYEPGYTAQFGHVLTSQARGNLPHRSRRHHASTLLWYYAQSGAHLRDHDALRAGPPGEKPELFSTVCSSKRQRHTLHRLRYEFTMNLARRMPELAVFGHGVRAIADKTEAIDPYRYHLVFENEYAPHHWTEKLADAFLGGALPFYFGCPNLADYFPPESFIRVDARRPGEAERIIRAALANDEFSRRREALAEARRLVLERYNLFAVLAGLIENTPGETPAAVPPVRFYGRRASRLRHPWRLAPVLVKKALRLLRR